jgi:hypothetical protein
MSVVTEYIQHPLLKDTALDNERQHVQYTMLGAQDTISFTIQDTSVTSASPNNSSCQFSYRPQTGSIVDREFLLEVKVQVTATGGQFGNYFAPKQWPLARVMDNLLVQANNSSVSNSPSSYSDILGRHKTSQEYFKKYRSMTPCQEDSFNRYENYALGQSYAVLDADSHTSATANGGARTGVGGTDTTLSWISYYSPFCTSIQSIGDDLFPRGAFPYDIPAGGDPAVSRIYTFTEPLLSPFCMQREGHGVAHLNDLTVKVTWASQLERMFCAIRSIASPNVQHVPAAGNFTASWTNVKVGDLPGGVLDNRVKANSGGSPLAINIISARLIIKSISPSPEIPIAPKCDISYNEFQFVSQPIGSVKTKQSVTFPITKLQCVPSHMYIWGRPQLNTQTRYNADAFLRFDDIRLTLGTKAGILSSLTPQQLYLMSTENGMNISYPQFIQYVGSPLCIALGKDIGGIKPGLAEMLDFYFNATVSNTTYFDHSLYSGGAVTMSYASKDTILMDQSIQWELCCLFVYPANATFAPGGFSAQSTGFRDGEIEEAKSDGPSRYDHEEGQEPIGGSMGSWLRRNFRKGYHLTKKHIRPLANGMQAASMFAPQLKPVAGYVDKAASMMGEGFHSKRGRGLLKN